MSPPLNPESMELLRKAGASISRVPRQDYSSFAHSDGLSRDSLPSGSTTRQRNHEPSSARPVLASHTNNERTSEVVEPRRCVGNRQPSVEIMFRKMIRSAIVKHAIVCGTAR
jgi:hypothetical protein